MNINISEVLLMSKKRNTYFNPKDTRKKDREKWKRLKALDEADNITYERLTDMVYWRNNQRLLTLGTMKTYFDMTKHQYECAKYILTPFNTKPLTPYGRANTEELLLAICLHVQPKPNYIRFLQAIKDYQCSRKKVLWLVNNLFK